jgi:MtN3 and saliva related transmembrane protein
MPATNTANELWNSSMTDPTSLLGLTAAALTSLSYVPQMRKVLPSGSTGDLSLKMLLALFAGLALWIVYGAVIGDFIIIAANAIGASLVGTVLICKIRDMAAK